MKALHVPHILPTFNIYTASQNNEVLVHNNNNNNNIETVLERYIYIENQGWYDVLVHLILTFVKSLNFVIHDVNL